MFGGEFPPPREFQVLAHEALREGLRNGHRCQLVMAPTGAGKTYLGMQAINEALKKGRRAMFVCDRLTLIKQTSNVATDYGLENHSIIQSGNPRLDLSKRFQIASAQTLMRRGWPESDVIIVDEAHTLYKTWVDYVASPACKAAVIGLSATPFAKGLGRIFTNLINAATMDQLTRDGVLVPMRVFSCRRPDMTGAKTTNAGEWTDGAAEEAELILVGDLVTEWTRIAYQKKTIVFGPTIRYCEALCEKFLAAGVQAAVYTSRTTDDERTALLGRFTPHDGDLRVLISVEALAKGFDVRDVECVCDARPLRKSLSTAIQMWGRGLRSSPETGKTECILLDFSGNIIRFADDFSDVFFNGLSCLDAGEKLDKEVREDKVKEPKKCPKCGYSPLGRQCVSCGFKPEAQSLIEHLPGEMQEISLNKRLSENRAELYAQCATYAKQHSAPEKQRGRTAHLFKKICGNWPPNGWTPESAPWMEPSRALMGKIQSLNIAFQRQIARSR